jgi:hypothetical protein
MKGEEDDGEKREENSREEVDFEKGFYFLFFLFFYV